VPAPVPMYHLTRSVISLYHAIFFHMNLISEFCFLQFSRVLIALALITGAAAFAPSTRFAGRTHSALDASIMDTLRTLEGPGIMWGSDGVLQGHEESDIRGQESYSSLCAAIDAAGLAATLSGPGPFTLFAPTNSAMAAPGVAGTMTAERLKYHILPAAVTKGAIAGDQMTLQGSTLHYKRFARQTFMDDAVVGLVPQGAATGVAYPVDIQCDNGVIHTIDQCLMYGYTQMNAETGLGGVQ